MAKKLGPTFYLLSVSYFTLMGRVDYHAQCLLQSQFFESLPLGLFSCHKAEKLAVITRKGLEKFSTKECYKVSWRESRDLVKTFCLLNVIYANLGDSFQNSDAEKV